MFKKKIESLLFASAKPLSRNFFIKFFRSQEEIISTEQLEIFISDLKRKYNEDSESGIVIVEAGDGWQMVTSGDCSETVKMLIKDETVGELTPASLETLTVIAYRGPIAKAELEQIRGVNCSLILRNLLIRGLIIAKEDISKNKVYYQVTIEFLKYLGLNSVNELPDFAKLSQATDLQAYLDQSMKE